MIQWIPRCQCHIFCPDNVWRPKPVPNKYGIDMTPTSLRQVKRWDVLFCFNEFFNIWQWPTLYILEWAQEEVVGNTRERKSKQETNSGA